MHLAGADCWHRQRAIRQACRTGLDNDSTDRRLGSIQGPASSINLNRYGRRRFALSQTNAGADVAKLIDRAGSGLVFVEVKKR
jgi:hypothetical protein